MKNQCLFLGPIKAKKLMYKHNLCWMVPPFHFDGSWAYGFMYN